MADIPKMTELDKMTERLIALVQECATNVRDSRIGLIIDAMQQNFQLISELKGQPSPEQAAIMLRALVYAELMGASTTDGAKAGAKL